MSQASEQIARQFANANINKVTWGDLIYNVKVYGAVGDGVTDDTAAFIAARAASGVGYIYAPDGTYKINGVITGDDLYIKGSGIGKTIIKANNPNAFIANASRCKLIDLTLQGQGKTNTTVYNGFKLYGDIYVENFEVKDFSGEGLNLQSVYRSVLIKAYFTDNVKGLRFDGTIWGGISCTSCKIIGGHFLRNTAGIYNTDADDIRNLDIDSCLFDVNTYGIQGDSIVGIIRNSWFEHSVTNGVYAVNSNIMEENNHYAAAADAISCPQSGSMATTSRGYTRVDSFGVTARKLTITVDGGQGQYPNLETSWQITTGKLELANTNITGTTPKPVLSQELFKESVISYHNTYSGGTGRFGDNNTGFTFTKLSTGKYHINFNRILTKAEWELTVEMVDTTPANLNNVDLTYGRRGHVVGVNTSSVSNYKEFLLANGVVILITDLAGAMADGSFNFTLKEVVTNITLGF